MVRLTPSVLIMNHCQAVPNKPLAQCQAGISNFDTFASLGVKLVADGVLSTEQLVEKSA